MVTELWTNQFNSSLHTCSSASLPHWWCTTVQSQDCQCVCWYAFPVQVLGHSDGSSSIVDWKRLELCSITMSVKFTLTTASYHISINNWISNGVLISICSHQSYHFTSYYDGFAYGCIVVIYMCNGLVICRQCKQDNKAVSCIVVAMFCSQFVHKELRNYGTSFTTLFTLCENRSKVICICNCNGNLKYRQIYPLADADATFNRFLTIALSDLWGNPKSRAVTCYQTQ